MLWLRDVWLMRILGWIGRRPIRNMVLYLAAVVVVAACIYSVVEKDISYIDGLWWAVVTLTTVGYGDISPASVGMRIVAVWVMASGIISVAVLTGVIAGKMSVAALADADRTPGIDDDFGRLSEDLSNAVERVKLLQERFRLDERGDDLLAAAARDVVSQFEGDGVRPEAVSRLRDALHRQRITDA